jgi:hypothetical protein
MTMQLLTCMPEIEERLLFCEATANKVVLSRRAICEQEKQDDDDPFGAGDDDPFGGDVFAVENEERRGRK